MSWFLMILPDSRDIFLLPQVRTVPESENEVDSRALQGTAAFGIRQTSLTNLKSLQPIGQNCLGKRHGAPLGVSALACTDGGL
jgi:hypothetical protein